MTKQCADHINMNQFASEVAKLVVMCLASACVLFGARRAMKRDVLLSMTPKHGLDLTRSLEIDPAKYWVWTNFNSYQQDLTPSTFFNLCNFSTMRITISTLALAFVLPTALCSPQLVAPFMKCPVDLVDRCLAKAGPPDLLTIALPERICTTEDDFIECLECGCEEVQTLREMGQEECEKIVKLFFGGPM